MVKIKTAGQGLSLTSNAEQAAIVNEFLMIFPLKR